MVLIHLDFFCKPSDAMFNLLRSNGLTKWLFVVHMTLMLRLNSWWLLGESTHLDFPCLAPML